MSARSRARGDGRPTARQRPSAGRARSTTSRLATLAADPRVARVMLDRHDVRDAGTHSRRTGRAVVAYQIRRHRARRRDRGHRLGHHDLERRPATSPRPADPHAAVVHFKDFTRDELRRLWSSICRRTISATARTSPASSRGSGYDSRRPPARHRAGPKLVGLKVLDRDGHGYISDVIEAIDYAIVASRPSTTSASSTSRSAPACSSPTATTRSRRRPSAPSTPASSSSPPPATSVATANGETQYGRHHVPRQRTVGADGWCLEPPGHEPAQRRRHRELQLAWSDVDRLRRQA